MLRDVQSFSDGVRTEEWSTKPTPTEARAVSSQEKVFDRCCDALNCHDMLNLLPALIWIHIHVFHG